MRKPRPGGATWPECCRTRTHLPDADDPDRSVGLSSPTVEKSSPFSGDFSLASDRYPSIRYNGWCPYHNSVIELRGCIPRPFTTAGREAKRESACPAARPLLQAGSPDRAAGANGGAHRLDRPSEGLAPSQRKADRKSDRRERIGRRSL